MDLRLYNTLSRETEVFTPRGTGPVTMYICGPTVYNYAHIGNARPYTVFGVLARMLRRRHGLRYARNLTDIEHVARLAQDLPRVRAASFNLHTRTREPSTSR